MIYAAPIWAWMASDVITSGTCHLRCGLKIYHKVSLLSSCQSAHRRAELYCTTVEQSFIFSPSIMIVMRFEPRVWLSNCNFISGRNKNGCFCTWPSGSCTLNACAGAQSLCLCSNRLLLAQIFYTPTSKNSHAASNSAKIHWRIENQMLSVGVGG